MTLPVIPFELMTAAERAGARSVLEAIRLNGARIERSGKLIGDADVSPVPRGELLAHCGRMVQIVADLTELMLDRTAPAEPISFGAPDRG